MAVAVGEAAVAVVVHHVTLPETTTGAMTVAMTETTIVMMTASTDHTGDPSPPQNRGY